jgi:hypothetical protein
LKQSVEKDALKTVLRVIVRKPMQLHAKIKCYCFVMLTCLCTVQVVAIIVQDITEAKLYSSDCKHYWLRIMLLNIRSKDLTIASQI